MRALAPQRRPVLILGSVIHMVTRWARHTHLTGAVLLSWCASATAMPTIDKWAGSMQKRRCDQKIGDYWGGEHAVALLDVLAMEHNLHLHNQHECKVVDIGAHHGTTALMAAELGCEVWAFEIEHRSLGILRRNVRESGCGDLIHIFTNESADSVVPASVHPTLVKIDVDGADAEVAQGARRLLRQALAGQFEINLVPGQRLNNSIATLDLFTSAGMTAYAFWYKDPNVVGSPRWPHMRNLHIVPPGVYPIQGGGDRDTQTAVPLSHPIRAQIRACGRGGQEINMTALIPFGLKSRFAELDAYTFRHSSCSHFQKLQRIAELSKVRDAVNL